MKLNLKGSDGLKALALQHGEKVGMVVVGLCVVMFLYSAMGHERLPEDKQYDDLTQKVRTSKQNMDSFTWAKALDLLQESESPIEGELPPVILPVPFPNTATAPVPAKPYELAGPFDGPVVPPTTLRPDPVLLTITDIEVHGWSALVPFFDEATRKRRILEAQKAEAEARRAAEKAAADAARDAERGRRRRGGDRMFGGEGERGGYGYPGGGMVDPDNPNRRMATSMIRPEGVAIQGDELIKEIYGATILAKVPVEEQIKLYRNALENAKGGYVFERDRPRYLAYKVQRAELTGADELKWEDVKVRSGSGKRPFWTGVSAASLADAVYDWPQEMEDISDARYIHPILTFPLPPLVGKNWGERARHSEVPLQADYDPEEEMRKLETPQETEKPGEEDNLFGGTPGTQPGMGYGESGRGFGGARGFGGEMGYGGGMRRGGGEMGYGGGMRRGGGEMGYGGGMRMGGSEMGFGGEGGFGGGYGGMATGVRRSPDGVEEPVATQPFWMFRFFDMDVQPGKRYRYRVQLVLRDVNAAIPRQYLDGEVIARLGPLPKIDSDKPVRFKPRYTDWSKPSPAVSIPMAGEVRVAEATPASTRQFNSEPTAKLLVKSYDVDDSGKAIHAGVEETFRRGSVMNMVRSAETLMGQYIDKINDFRFRTGATLLDIEGGERLTSDMDAPAKVLVMDAGGRLSVRSDLKDLAEVEQHRLIFAPPDQNRRGFPGGGYGEGFGGEGGFRRR